MEEAAEEIILVNAVEKFSRMRLLGLLGAISALPVAVAAAHNCEQYYRDYQQEPLIVIETKDCAGNAGLASFRAERVFKVQAGKCQDPDDPDQPLYQVMLKTLIGTNDYDVVWVDSAGMRAIREQLEENRRAALHRGGCYRSPDRPVKEDQSQD
jgi:hypothetical protein